MGSTLPRAWRHMESMIFDWLSLTLLAALTAALLFGGMVFYALLFTPLSFRHLPRELAGAFLRRVFPAYYLTGALLAGLAGLFALWAQPLEAAILLIVAFGFSYARLVLLPKIDSARLLADGGAVTADGRFRQLHRLSVAINLLQLLAVALVLTALILAA